MINYREMVVGNDEWEFKTNIVTTYDFHEAEKKTFFSSLTFF